MMDINCMFILEIDIYNHGYSLLSALCIKVGAKWIAVHIKPQNEA